MNEDWLDDKLSLNNFKKWLKEQNDAPEPRCCPRKSPVGLTVQPKISCKRLVIKMEAESGEPEELALDFKRDGGIVIESEDKTFLIEVAGGTFRIHRCYVKKMD